MNKFHYKQLQKQTITYCFLYKKSLLS